MGDANQLLFVRDHLKVVRGPVLEVGSKDYGNTQDFRALLPGCHYVGVDLEPGRGVDVVLDMTADMAVIRSRLPVEQFGTIICFSVLEHCRNPFQMCANLSALLGVGGMIFISVPFCWHIHAYPADYWRFTPEGIKLLFPGFDFDRHPGEVTTWIEGDREPIAESMMQVMLSARKARQSHQCGPLSAMALRILRLLGLLQYVLRYKSLYPLVQINMIGVKQQ